MSVLTCFTAEFAVLESLLNLFARLLPSSSSAKQKFESFISDTFLRSFAVYDGCGEKITQLLNEMMTKDWEKTATKLFDILAGADIGL